MDALKNLQRPSDRPRLLYASDPTIIGLNLQFEAHPTQGILGLYDEASKLFAFDRTSSGKSDRSDVLSYYNGLGQTELRKDGVRANFGESIFGIFGAIQPEVLIDLINLDNPDGQWSRFLLVNQPLQCKRPSRKQVIVDIQGMMVDTYRKVLALPQGLYSIDEAGQELFDDYLYGKIEDLRLTTLDRGMAAVYGKVGGRMARLALNLHVLKEIGEPGTFGCRVISDATIRNAIALSDFYLDQVQIFFSQARSKAGELSAKLAAIVQYSQQCGAVSTRDLKRGPAEFRNEDPTQIRDWFKLLESLNKGRLIGTEKRVKFLAH